MNTVWQDLRYGARMLLKARAFTLVAVLSLALGIGANTALFSLVDTVLLKKLPVKDPEQLVLLEWLAGESFRLPSLSGYSSHDQATGLKTSTSFSYPAFTRLRQEDQVFSELFAFEAIEQLNVQAGEQAEITTGQIVSGNYYRGLGVQPLIGRTITDEDLGPQAAPVAVLSHRFWQRRFGQDPSVVGRQINVNNVACTIVGITPREFDGTLQVGESPDLTLPISLEPQLRANSGSLLDKADTWWLQMIGRLKPGVTREQAQASLEPVFLQSALEMEAALPPPGQGQPPRLEETDRPRLKLTSGSQGLNEQRKSYEKSLWLLMGVVALVLAVACANVANLLLARSEARRKEIAVRLALGANRWRLVRQLLTESLLLAALGGVTGTLFALWAKDALMLLRPWGDASSNIELSLDWRVLGFTVALSVLTGMLFGLVPALRATRVSLTMALKDSVKGSGGGTVRSFLTKALVVAQVAMSLLLLVGAGLFIRTLSNLRRVDGGFNQQNLLLFRVDPRLNGYEKEGLAALYQRMVERLEAVPGVRAVTCSRHALLSGSSNISTVVFPGQEVKVGVRNLIWRHQVRANFLEVMEIPLVMGRNLTPQDDARAPKVVVVNQAFVRKYLPNENPLGKRFGSRPEKNSEIEIVGVARDARYNALRDEIPPTVYAPYLQETVGQMNFEIRTAGEPALIVPAIRQAVAEVDSRVALFEIRTQAEQTSELVAEERLFTMILSFFGLLAQLLAAVGLYGVMSYSVAQRTHEIGIRVALGAQARDILRMVISQGMILALVGVAVGLGAAFYLTRLLEKLLFGVRTTDPLTFVGVTSMLIAVALAACFIPARRATRVDPMEALRYE
jgi:predicted permease